MYGFTISSEARIRSLKQPFEVFAQQIKPLRPQPARTTTLRKNLIEAVRSGARARQVGANDFLGFPWVRAASTLANDQKKYKRQQRRGRSEDEKRKKARAVEGLTAHSMCMRAQPQAEAMLLSGAGAGAGGACAGKPLYWFSHDRVLPRERVDLSRRSLVTHYSERLQRARFSSEYSVRSALFTGRPRHETRSCRGRGSI
ncbi:hypothetical protein EVAR_87799_1 [Eumeta japonica]|uniref:Uncharacterized protein n=1 Tax=Eumeta variegata TaxID=151549 RepID=A0A4C1X3D4_EUMVA|nr:hypothetical protein EVAR_87799_1 [Eumeta japonica]